MIVSQATQLARPVVRGAILRNIHRVSKLKNESMRINSNAIFFGRASLGMKKATTSVAVATFFFATDTDFRIYRLLRHVTKYGPQNWYGIHAALLELKGELPTTLLA